MSATIILAFVRLIHIVAGTFWVGGAILVAVSVVPAIRAAGPAGVAVMRQLMTVQRLPYALICAGLLSLISGAYLTYVVSTGDLSNWLRTDSGLTYATGACAAVMAAVIGLGINIPTAARLGNLQSQTAAVQQQLSQKLARRLTLGTRAGALFLLIAISAMAVARYVP
jgi:uncharacterized membrane protein